MLFTSVELAERLMLKIKNNQSIVMAMMTVTMVKMSSCPFKSARYVFVAFTFTACHHVVDAVKVFETGIIANNIVTSKQNLWLLGNLRSKSDKMSATMQQGHLQNQAPLFQTLTEFNNNGPLNIRPQPLICT